MTVHWRTQKWSTKPSNSSRIWLEVPAEVRSCHAPHDRVTHFSLPHCTCVCAPKSSVCMHQAHKKTFFPQTMLSRHYLMTPEHSIATTTVFDLWAQYKCSRSQTRVILTNKHFSFYQDEHISPHTNLLHIQSRPHRQPGVWSDLSPYLLVKSRPEAFEFMQM